MRYLAYIALIIFFFSTTRMFCQYKLQLEERQQPNIIFILTDDLGWGDLGIFYQEERQKINDRSEPWTFTPNLDKMAGEGAILPHHYSAAPVCAPSRASLLSGVSQGHANVRDNQFDKALEENHTLATVLARAGYSTAAIGKWGLQGDNRWDDNGDKWPAHPLNRGFEYFLGYMRHRDGHEHYPKESIYRDVKEVWENRTNIIEGLDKCYTTDLFTAATKKWIIDHKKSKNGNDPFFVYLSYDTPHAVLELPTQAYPGGGGLEGGIQWIGKSGAMINTASGEVDSWIHPDYENATYDHDKNLSTSEVDWPEVYKRYAGSIRRIDDAVGDILQLLRDLKIDKNTLVVFTSDNGPSLESYIPGMENNPDFFNSFGPFAGVKRDVLEGGVRMPTIAYWPSQIPPNKVIETPSISYDWMPTFAEVSGVPTPARSDGTSLLPSLTGKGKQNESLIYVEYFNNGMTPDFQEFNSEHRKRERNQMQMIRLEDYVGLRYNIQSQADNFEIYDLVNDPGQNKNIANIYEMQELQIKMKEKVLQVRRPDDNAPRPYDNEYISPVQDKKKEPGVDWKIYFGYFPWIPDVATFEHAINGRATSLNLEVFESEKPGILFFEGYFEIPEDGEYTFYLNSNGSTLLQIHEATVIDADYGYKRNSERKGNILLKAGLHPFRFYYLKAVSGKPCLDLKWKGPGLKKQEISSNFFRSVAK